MIRNIRKYKSYSKSLPFRYVFQEFIDGVWVNGERYSMENVFEGVPELDFVKTHDKECYKDVLRIEWLARLKNEVPKVNGLQGF